MNIKQFESYANNMVDYMCNYMNSSEERPVKPDCKPGFLINALPGDAPEEGEEFKDIMEDVDKLIIPGITDWQHSNFHAYYPSGNSFPSIMGDMLSDALGCMGDSWQSSPACTELEIVVVDWMARMMNLPAHFIHGEKLGGGGVIQTSASDAMLVTMISARQKIIRDMTEQFFSTKDATSESKETLLCEFEVHILKKLVGYKSKLAFSGIEKNSNIGLIKVRTLPVDENFSMRGRTLEKAIEKDLRKGYIPFFVFGSHGTTGLCSYDNIEEIGPVCEKYGLWLHIDAAYAGGALLCPELRDNMKGLEYADSMDFNPNKFMLTNFDCSILWVKKSEDLKKVMSVDNKILHHKYHNTTENLQNWGVPMSRRFRSLKLWFTIKNYGVEGLQKYIRNHVNLAKKFEEMVLGNSHFELIGKVTLGLVCFRLRPRFNARTLLNTELNTINKNLLSNLNDSGNIYLTPAQLDDVYFLRFCICREHATVAEVEYSWRLIRAESQKLISEYASHGEAMRNVEKHFKDRINKNMYDKTPRTAQVPVKKQGYNNNKDWSVPNYQRLNFVKKLPHQLPINLLHSFQQNI